MPPDIAAGSNPIPATAQVISYEIAMGFCFIVPVLLSGSMSLIDIVRAQKDWWFFLLNPAAGFIFFISMLAETNRAPFDMAEGESEIVAGPLVEYSGMTWSLFFLAEYANMLMVATLSTILFMGGWLTPIPHSVVELIPAGFVVLGCEDLNNFIIKILRHFKGL